MSKHVFTYYISKCEEKIFVYISLVCLRSSMGNNICSRLGNLQQGSRPREGAVVGVALVRSQS